MNMFSYLEITYLPFSDSVFLIFKKRLHIIVLKIKLTHENEWMNKWIINGSHISNWKNKQKLGSQTWDEIFTNTLRICFQATREGYLLRHSSWVISHHRITKMLTSLWTCLFCRSLLFRSIAAVALLRQCSY